ncbi:MAG TPA: thiamine pyrophosphate-binding protein [Myxococcales bacterium]
MRSGGQLVARMLEAEGVRHVFTLSGLHVAPIYAACVEQGIKLVDTRHEQAAGHAADAYARLRRGLGVAVVTAGPGVTDALTAVANAWAANTPMLLIGGAAPTFNQGRGALQEMEQVPLFKTITKWADRVPAPELVPAFMAKAFRVALSGRPGPVFLEIPWDVLSNGVEDDAVTWPKDYRTTARSLGDPRLVERAIDLLRKAERPAVIAGSSIWWDGAAERLSRFAELSQIPVFLNGAGRGCLPLDHPLHFQKARKDVLTEADAVLVLGTPFDFRLSYGADPTFGPSTTIVQVDIDPAEIGRNRPVEVGIAGHSDAVLGQLVDGWGAKVQRDGYLKRVREAEAARREKQRAFESNDQIPIHHFRAAREMSVVANAAGDPTWVADGGNWVAIAAKVVELKGPGRWLDPGPLGCLGVGAPFAMAAALLHPERLTWVIQGDGSFGLNGFDYETMLRFKLPCVIVVGNDAAWGQIRLPQVQMYGEEASPATRLAPTRYDRIIEAMGGVGFHVTEPRQLLPALEKAAASGTVACVNVELDPQAPASSGAQGYAM